MVSAAEQLVSCGFEALSPLGTLAGDLIPSHLAVSPFWYGRYEGQWAVAKMVTPELAKKESGTLSEVRSRIAGARVGDRMMRVPDVLAAVDMSETVAVLILSYEGSETADALRCRRETGDVLIVLLEEICKELYERGIVWLSSVPRNVVMPGPAVVLCDWELGLRKPSELSHSSEAYVRAIQLIEELSPASTRSKAGVWSTRWPSIAQLSGEDPSLTDYLWRIVDLRGLVDPRYADLAEWLHHSPIVSDILLLRFAMFFASACEPFGTHLSSTYALDILCESDMEGSVRIDASALLSYCHAHDLELARTLRGAIVNLSRLASVQFLQNGSEAITERRKELSRVVEQTGHSTLGTDWRHDLETYVHEFLFARPVRNCPTSLIDLP
jgi:hypothetical protein